MSLVLHLAQNVVDGLMKVPIAGLCDALVKVLVLLASLISLRTAQIALKQARLSVSKKNSAVLKKIFLWIIHGIIHRVKAN